MIIYFRYVMTQKEYVPRQIVLTNGENGDGNGRNVYKTVDWLYVMMCKVYIPPSNL